MTFLLSNVCTFYSPTVCSVDRYRQLPVGSTEEDDKELDKLVR